MRLFGSSPTGEECSPYEQPNVGQGTSGGFIADQKFLEII